MEKQLAKTSKFLSFVLRHKPEAIGIVLDKNGWIETTVLLEACRSHNHAISREELEEVVRSNDKKRFAFNEDGSKIRASQGYHPAFAGGAFSRSRVTAAGDTVA